MDKSKTEKKRGHQRSGSDLDLANTESTMQENTVSSSNESYNYRRIFFAEEGKLLGESELRQSFQDLRNSISSDPDALLNVGFDDILDTLPYVGFDNLSDDDALQKEAGKDFDDDDHISQFKQQLEEYEVSRLAIKAGDVDHNHRSKGDTPSSPRLARGTALSSRAGQQTGLSRGHSFNPHEKDPALSQSFHSVSNAHTKMSGVDDVDMNFDVEDWDSELNIDNSDYDLHDSNGPTMSLLKENLPKDVPNEESLLEFLEACVHQSISQGIASMNERVDDLETLDLRGLHAVGIEKPPNPGSSLDIIPRNSSSFYIPQGIGTSMNKSFYEQEENKFLESANQHLKGLFEWIDATSTNIKSVITESNSTATVNGQISLEKEVVSTQIDISPMLDVCEEQPTRESCIQSLEMIVYWMRGVASQVKEHERHPNLRFATERFHNVPDQLEHNSSFFGTISGKFGDESSIHGLSAANLKNTSGASRASTFRDANSNTAGSRFGRSGNNTSGFSVGPGAVPTTGTADNIKIITQRSFDRIFSRCDYILSEQTRYTTSRVLEIHTILAMQLSIDDYISRATVNGNVALDVAFHNAAVDATAATLSDEYTRSNVVQMMNLLANHISLCRIQIHMLEIKIHMYRSAFDLFGTLEKIQYISDELDAILNTWLKNLNFFLPSSQTIASLRNAENNNQWKKESKRVYSQDQAEILTKVIVDLQGLCVANKLLSVCGISPITYEEYTDIVTVGNLDDKTKSRDVQMLDKNLNTKNKSKYFGLVRINSKYMRSSYDEIDYDEVDTDNKTLQMYNVFYELGIGNQFIDLMLLIPSPSITRSKLSFAAYEYLNKLKSDRLPWQKNSRYSLKSIKPTSPDGFSDFKSVGNPNVEAEFGIGSEEIDTTTGNEVMSVGEVESNILQSFSEAFGNLDDVRILQLLLYEASVDMYPPVKKAQENNSNRRAYSEQVFHTDATASTKFKSSVGRASNRNSKSVNGEDIPTTNMSGQLLAAVAAGVENVQSIFHNVPLSINLNHSLMETIKESLYDLQVHYIDDFDDITITYILRYELYNFSYNLFFNLANCIVDTSPISALDLYEQCIILLGHLNKSAEQYKLQKEVTILAVKLEKQDSAIFHGKAVLEVLKRQDDAVNELLYITDLLIDQYCENSQYELAIKLIFEIVQKFVVSNKNMSKGKKSQVRAESVMQKLECQRATDKLLLKLSQIFLHYGCSDKSVDVLQLMLSSYSERTDSLVNDQSKITIISWLIEAYLAMEDFDACNKLVRTIKDIRIDKIFASLENPTTTATITNSRPASWRMFNAASDSQTVFIPHKALSSGLAVPNRCTLTGRDGGYTPFIRTRSVRSGISTRSFDKSSLYTVEPDKMSIGGDRFDDQFLNEVGLINYQMNTLDSNLPKFCVTSHNTDLGHITARIYFKSKLYIPALKSLTPTIIGVELVVGGKNGSKEGMLELGNLYFLRGQIQLEASKSVSEIRYPFDVGSSQLFSAIQLLSAEIRKNRRMQKIHRKFIRSDARNIPYLVRNDSVNSSFDHSNSKAGTTYSTTHHFFTCKRAITYSCPSDLLWDAMKWFRRAWDLFHAAGDEIWAARSANYIAKCHLEPTFVPHAFFQMPLDISCNLSVYVQDSRDAKDSSDWNPGSFAGIPSASSTGIASRQVVAAKLVDPKSDEDEGNRTISPSGSRNASAQMAFEHAHNQAALNAFIVNIDVENSLGIDDNRRDQLYAQQELGLHTLTQPRISNPKVTTSKRGKSSSASVLTRYASLEEVDRVMRFALDISVESCLPLLLIESHLNMAELYILQGI